MAEASVGDSSLAHQCLALCQTLASQGRTFSLSLTAGSSFIFSMESKGVAIPAEKVKKKSSPSTLRRNTRKRDIFLRRKLESHTKMEASSECPPCPSSPPPPITSPKKVEGRPFKCDLCAASFVSKHGLKYHMESIHKTVPPGSAILHPSGIQNPSSSPFPCGQCTHSFSSGTTLKHHIEHSHTSSNIPNSSAVQHLIPDSWG